MDHQHFISSQRFRETLITILVIVLFAYTFYRRERKLMQYANSFKQILEQTPTLMVLEINLATRSVRTSSPIFNIRSESGDIPFDAFCAAIRVTPVALERAIVLASACNDEVIKSTTGVRKYRLSGKMDTATAIFRGVCLDISNEENQKKVLKDRLAHDPLTGLRNRYRLNKSISKFCSASATEQYSSDDSVLPIRLSGDEFLIIKRGILSTEQANDFIHQLISTITALPIVLSNGTQIFITLSCGGVVYNNQQSTEDIDRIIKSADNKMYEMKKSGIPASAIQVALF
eukprot:gene5875-6794_t